MEESYTGKQRAFCVREVYKNKDSYDEVPSLYQKHFGLPDLSQCPSVGLIRTWVENFEGTGSTHTRPTRASLISTSRLCPEVGPRTKASASTGNGDIHPALESVKIKLEPGFDLEETQDAIGPPQDIIEVSDEIKQEYNGFEVTPDIVVGSRTYEA